MTYMPDAVFWIDERANTAIHGMAERMSVHTGVKWQLQRTPYESEIDIVSDGRVIATVEAGEDKEEIAQMIVSAPDMLAVLEKLSSLLVDGEEYVPLELREELTTAIQKARGEV